MQIQSRIFMLSDCGSLSLSPGFLQASERKIVPQTPVELPLPSVGIKCVELRCVKRGLGLYGHSQEPFSLFFFKEFFHSVNFF